MWAFRMRPAVQRVIGRSALVLGAGLFFVQPQLDYSRTTYTPYSSTYVSARPVVTVAAPKFVQPLPSGNLDPTERVTEATGASFELRSVDFWAIGACLVLLWTLFGTLKIRQIRRRGELRSSEGSLRIVSEPSVTTPFVAGLFRPTLFIPIDWEGTTSPDEREFVLQHERAHLANCDLPWLYLSRLIIALCWPNPLFWLVAARLRAVSETLSDESVLAAGADPRAYAACLLNHHQRARKHAPSVAFSTVGRKSSLSQRIEAIIDHNGRRVGMLRFRAKVMILLGIVSVASLAILAFGKPVPKSELPITGPDGVVRDRYDVNVVVQGRPGSKVHEAWIVSFRDSKLVGKKIGNDDSHVFVREADFSGAVAQVVAFMTNGDVAIARLALQYDKVSRMYARPTRKIEAKVEGIKPEAQLPSFDIAMINLQMGAPDAGNDLQIPAELQSKFPIKLIDRSKLVMEGVPDNAAAYLRVSDPDLTLTDRGRQLWTDAAHALNQTVKVHPSSSISGRVTMDGKPMAGIEIAAQIQNSQLRADVCSWGTVLSDTDGNYTIPKLSGAKYNVTAMLTPQQEREIAVRAVEGVSLPTAGKVTGINIALEPATTITGTVRDENGKPLTKVYMGVYGPSRPESSAMMQVAVTDERGVFVLHVPSGKHRVYVSDSSWENASKQLETQLGKPTVADFVTKSRQEEEVRVGRQPTEDELKEMKEREKVEAAEREPTPAAMSFGPGEPFYGPVKLKSGVTIKLEFMQCIVDGRDRIWQPDGSAPTSAQTKISLPLGFKPESGDVRRMLGHISFDKKLAEFPTSIVQVPQPSSWNVYQSYGVQNDNRSINMASFRANKTLRQTDMKFGVATGPWKVIGGITFESAGNSQRDDLRLTQIDFAPGTRAVHYSLDTKWSNYDVQGRAYDYKGKPYELDNYTPPKFDPKSGQLRGSLTFSGKFDPKSDFKAFNRVELIARPYEWVTFKGIHLYPN